MPDKRALCVGLNKFKNIPQANWLYGCVNDANDMAALLTSAYGFAAGNITILTDAKATKKAVLAQLESMVQAAEQGSLKHLVFTFSSHGTQVPDTSGDEPDGVDEAFVTYDLAQAGDNWDVNTLIVDDELGALFARVPAGVVVEVFLDTCHSGTGLKALDLLPGRMPRFLPPPTPIGLDGIAKRSSSLLGEPTGTRSAKAFKPAKRVARAPRFKPGKAFRSTGTPKGATPILYAACRADQTSSDASFNGRSNGAFTYYLLQAVASTPTAPRADLIKVIGARLKSGRYDQVPQLECAPAQKKARLGS